MSIYSVIHRGQETVYKSRIIALAAYSNKTFTYPNAHTQMLVDGVVIHEHNDPMLSLKVPYYILETNSTVEGIQSGEEAREAFYDARDLAVEEGSDVVLTKVVHDKNSSTGYREYTVRSCFCETGTTLGGE